MNEEFTILIEELRTPSDGWSGDASCIDAEVGVRAANTIEALINKLNEAAEHIRKADLWTDEEHDVGNWREEALRFLEEI